MANRPRKTSEMGEGSQPRQSRISRIAQPIRRPSTRERSLERAPSCDRLTVGYQAGSAMKARKTSTYSTPLRTPSNTALRTEILLTAEKEKPPADKKWIQTQAARITEYLHCIEAALGGDFFNRGGLKSMTIKQFVIILKHFLTKIVGNRLTIGANYVDDVAKILSQIGYPYPVNKSWLKTPSAPHAYNNVVLILQWFLNFTANSEYLSDFEELLASSEEISNNSPQIFLRRIEECFNLWNNCKDDELEAIKENLVDELIEKKTGMKGMKAIEKEIDKLKAELDRLLRDKIVLKREQEFNQLDQEVKTKEKLVNKLQETCQNNQKQLTQLKEMIASKNESIADVKKRIEELQSKIASQEISVEERDEYIAKISYLKQCLNSKKNSVNQLHEMGAANQVLFSRLMKQKIEQISKFNNYLYQFFSEVEADIKPDVVEFCLDQNSELDLKDQIQRVLPILEQLTRKNLEEYRQCTTEISKLESELMMASYTHDKALEQSLAVMQKCIDAEKKLEEVNIHLINANVEGSKHLDELTQSSRAILEQNEKLNETIKLKEVELEKSQSQNKAMLDMLQEKVKDFISNQTVANAKLGEAVDNFKNTIDNITLKLSNINEFIA